MSTTIHRARVLVADDHKIVAEGVANLLRDRFEVVDVVAGGSALVAAAQRLRPDVVISDISMPGLNGLDAMAQVKRSGVACRFVFLTMHGDPEIAARALREGASAFLLKADAGEDLLHAIDETLQGRIYLAPAVTKGVLELMQGGDHTGREPQLTTRQREVLRLIVGGKRMKEVAAELGLSPRTVEAHKYEMMRSLGVHSSAELIRYAVEHRLV
jgi:DNA-binding NarL/FixJ family response regulator